MRCVAYTEKPRTLRESSRMADPRVTRRSAGTQSQARRSDARGGGHDPRQPRPPIIGWSRRVGIIIALTAVGGTIVLAGSHVLDDHSARHTSAPTASAGITSAPSQSAAPTGAVTPRPTAAAPTIEGPTAVTTRDATWSFDVALPTAIGDRRNATVRIYRDDHRVAEVDISRADTVHVSGLALKRGDNDFVAVVAGPSGEGPRSADVVVTRDDVAPQVAITAPSSGASVGTASQTVTGRADVGVTLTVSNLTTDASVEPVVATDGTFQAVVPLALGVNRISVQAVDEAGNSSSAEVDVTRIASQASANLHLTPATIKVGDLPASVSLDVNVIDENGAPADGASVVFTLSPSGLPTSTYHATTTDGTADWPDVTIPQQGAVAGDGFATVQVTLADGTVLRQLRKFTFQ